MCENQTRDPFECPFLERLTPEQRREKIKTDPLIRACIARRAEMAKRTKRANALSPGPCSARRSDEQLSYLV
jgi:hypothetical protein